ncbi:MAG: metallophosphoesterase [Clostridia bacterium]|nr:metallophosphoesterase [Clostridia bacterium]
MKKLISILLSVLMIFSLVSVGVSAADEKDLKITVANDLHYNLIYGAYIGDAYYDNDYSHVPENGQLWIESILIINTFFDEIAKNDSEILLIPGDLVDHGSIKEHETFSALLADFEKTSGKRVYVVPGNHDYYGTDKITPEDFATFYKEFGYNESTTVRDTNSASYTVDLNDEYRLLAVDSCKPGDGVSGIGEERKAWIEEQAKKAEKDGKKVISMMHHNMLDHFIFGEMIHPGAFVDSEIGLPELYAQYDIRFNLTGHTHSHDIKAYTGSNGVTIYDILTSSLNLYPLPYRNITFGKEVKIETEIIETVDVTTKEGIISENCYKLATENFQEYAYACASIGLDSVMDSYLSVSKIESLLHLNPVDDAEICSIIEKLLPSFRELIAMPLYKNDAMTGESLEVYAKELKLDFPKTELKTFKELAIFLYQQYVIGDENFGVFSAEFVLLSAALTTILNKLLADVSAEDYTNLLNYLAKYFNLKSIDGLSAYAGDAVSRMKGIDLFVSALGNSVILYFTTDELPADNNVTLPGYEEPAVAEEELSLWDKIVDFFRSIFDYFLRIFGIGK